MKKYNMKKVYLIWIWWIWVSAIARYYKSIWYKVYWSDLCKSNLTDELTKEWIEIFIWTNEELIDNSFDKVIYTEAISKNNSEYVKAINIWINTISYPEALSEIANKDMLIAISWTHWKSTTTTLTSLVLKNSWENFTSIVWTLIKEFWDKNFYHRNDKRDSNNYFVIEACEYKRSFIKYNPTVTVITNIELDHLDYYKDLEDYISAYKELINNTKSWWFVILNWEEENSKKLINYRQDINYIEIYKDYYKFLGNEYIFPEINLKIPWDHILYDAKIAYIIWHMLWMNNENIIDSLEQYNGVWRRMETAWYTEKWNQVISDYGHHPTEIKLTLWAIKEKYNDKKILTIFQPHQYNRTIELIEDFKNCFNSADLLIIPNIYESRDSEDDKKNMSTEKLVELINHKKKYNWNWFKNTIKLIKEIENKEWELIIVLMWAWDIDNMRFDLVK